MKLDFILIYGYDLHPEGEMDALLKARLDFGLERYFEGVSRNVIVTGRNGKGDKPYVDATGITEARIMRLYLEERGVKTVYEENLGTTSWECTKNSYDDIIAPRKWTSGMLVSNAEHLPRLLVQSNKVFPSDVVVVLSGPKMPDGPARDAFVAHELEAIRYTLSRTD